MFIVQYLFIVIGIFDLYNALNKHASLSKLLKCAGCIGFDKTISRAWGFQK